MISHPTGNALALIAYPFLKWSPRKYSFFHLVCIASVAFFFSAHRGVAATYTVNNATDFNNLPRLNAGDVVQMNSGTYGAINKTLESSISDDTTAKNNPVLVYAVTPGGVVVNAPSKITLSGRGIILAGLDFNANSGILADYLVGTASGSRYMKLSHLRFNGCAAGATDGKWIYIQGFYATIEYCTLTERPDTIRNTTVAFMPNLSEGGVAVPRMHKVRYCYFGPRYAVPQDTSSDTDNGFESLRIGVGDVQTYDMQVTVERNVFYRSIWRTDGATAGEPEIISIKSKGNKILNNTILESQGGICFRSGTGSTVEGNFIFGGGYYDTATSIALRTASANQGGIRVIGADQIVRNNYIANVVGDGIRAALCVMSGESDYNPGDPANGIGNTGSYQPANNAKIYNNTFVTCKEMSLGLLSNDSHTNSTGVYVAKSPANVQMFNNVWQGGNSAATSVINRDTSVVSGYTPIVLGASGANYIHETSSGKYGWNGLLNSTYTTTSPLITTSFDNYKIPAASSPILNKATNILVATTDIRGLTRTASNLDIGCFELEVTGSGLKPLLKSEVGVVFDGGPSSYPVAGSGDSRPNILTTSIAGGSVGTSFYQLMQASGGDGLIGWSISSGSLPIGLTLSGGGILAGTPTTTGTYTFTVRATDSDSTSPDTSEISYTQTISAAGGAKLTVTTSTALSYSSGNRPSYTTDGKTGTRWTSSFTPSAGKTGFGFDSTWIRWDLGSLKTVSYMNIAWYLGSSRTTSFKLEISNDGTTWTELRARGNSTGTTSSLEKYDFTDATGRYVRLVSYGNNTSSPNSTNIIEIEIYGSAYSPPDTRTDQAIVFGSLEPALQTDAPFALSAYATSALPVTFDCSDATVAEISGATVVIRGSGSAWITASQVGDTSFKPAPSVQQILTVTQVTPGITSNTGATAVRGLPFRYQITASRDATGYGATGLPSGLVVDAVTGKISGTATVSGSFPVTLSAQNSAGTGIATLNLNVVEPFVYETFESYTIGAAVPLVAPSSVTSGIKASGQVTTSAGTSTIGGVNGKVGWFNDSGASSGQLEFNAGASGQSYLTVSFELCNNATPSASGTMALAVSLVAWNANNTTAGGSSTKRIATIEFNQFGSLTTPTWTIKNSGTVASGTYAITSKQTVNLFANDHDSNSINYVGPDGNVRTLGANSFSVFLNGGFVGMYGLNLAAVDNSASPGVLLTGNNNLGRLGFNTSTTNTGNWLIDNVVVSDMPTDVVIPAPAGPIITSSASPNGQAGFAFSYITTNSELADSYLCDGTLPTGLSFNTSSGIISGNPNQSGIFPVTIYASNSAGTGSLDVTLNISPAPPNIFSGSDPSLNTAASWSLGAAPNSSSSGGSYTDLIFSSVATALTTTSGNINGKSYNVTNGSSYVFSSVRTNVADGTIYKIGATGVTEPAPFINTVTGVTNQLAYLANNSRITFSRVSPSNNVSSILQFRNSGTLQIETGSTLDIQTDINQTATNSAFGWTKVGGGALKLSGSNSYTGASIVQEGTLALVGQGSSAVTVKTNAILEIALTSSGTATFSNTAAVSLEAGSKVRVTGTPADGAIYTLVSASSITSLATLESSVSGYQLAVLNNSLQLQPVWAPAFSSSSFTATGAANGAFTYQISASGNPTSYGATGLPAGLVLNAATGEITGTPTVGGTYDVAVSATNAGGTGYMTLTLRFTDEFDALRLKWRNSLIAAGGTSIDSNALKYWTGSSPINLNPSSSAFYLWSDLPLNTRVSGNMRDTFDRLERMALAYANPSSTYYQNAALATAVINGLNWMVANVYNGTNLYDNWYHWMITGSQNFANAALLVFPALNSSEITSYYTRIDYYGPSGGPNGLSLWPTSYRWSLLTGANTAEAALVMTLNGILNKTDSKLTEANTNLAKVFAPVTSGDGFYADGGYIFHFNAVENGSYGLSLIEAVSLATNLLYGTQWAIPEDDASEAYDNWIPQGLMPFYYRGAMMHMIRGRSYTTSGSTGAKAGEEGIALMQQVALFAPTSQKNSLRAFANSPHPVFGQYMFPSIDRAVAHRSNFSLGLSLSSSRTCNFDPMRNTPSTQNNDKGWSTADGMTSLYVGAEDTQFTGNIWPTMDWFHMTGTTAEQNYQSQPGTPSENWAGGAEVSGYGVAGMSLHPNDSSTANSTLYGKKSYFMLEKEVVCLGAGIVCESANSVDTTVENRRMGSGTSSVNLWVDGVATSRSLNWGATLTSPKSCAIEGVGGYYFPDSPNNIRAEFVPSSGTWTDIHPTDSDTTTYTDNYLRLIFNHGARPSGATYAYTLLPAMAPNEVAGYAYNPQTTILSNTDTVQAVKNPTLGVVAANFWNSAGGTADLLAVNKSCSVISRETYNSISVGLSDPSQSLAGPGGVITVTLNRTGTLSSKDAEVTVVRTTPTIQFTANVSGARGKTIHATFSLAAAPVITSNLNMVGVTGSPLSYQIASDASGATYGATGLPQGLTVNTTTGLITGTPTESGTYTTTISATNGSGRTGYATLTIQVGANLSNLSSTFGASTTWVCPANVTAVQVECWGAGGAGGSAYKPVAGNAFGGGGAGGAYAKKNSVSVVPGASYTISIGAGGVSAISPSLTTVSGGDSWFGSGSVASCLAKGGGGGQSVISSGSGIVGSGGVGSSVGSVGDLFFAGGNGLVGQGSPTNTGGGGGGSAGISSVGGSATSYLGATRLSGGGAGGNGKDSTGNGDGSQGGSPGGGGGGARGSSVGSQALGGKGGAGQVVLTVVEIANVSQTAFASWSDNAEVTSESVYKYAFGAADTTSAPEKITSNITSTTLSLTAVVRTDDSNLVITPKSASTLGTWSATDPVISVVNAVDQTGLGAGLVRKVYSVERGIDSKRFLKLEAVYTP
jgi:hyaluronate lyase